MIKPELLAPAGNLTKLKIALSNGADACYAGGTVFGLRKYADNFTLPDLEDAVSFANDHGKSVYLVLNGFAHDTDLEELIPHFKDLQRIRPHAFIISDIGVMKLAQEYTDIPVHVSTQASVCNWRYAKHWVDQGAKRVILGREVSIQDCKTIKAKTGAELEVFIHGAQCASYSGKCVISNYTSGRDSNRGGCIQSCRHTYGICDSQPSQGDTANANSDPMIHTHIMNAKDMMAVSAIPDLIRAGLDSLKIEGRMKSDLYVATASRVYRNAIDHMWDRLSDDPKAGWDPAILAELEAELATVSNRTFSTGGLYNIPQAESIHYAFNGYEKSVDYVGTVRQVYESASLIADIRFPIQLGDTLEVVRQSGPPHLFTLYEMWNMADEALNQTQASTLIRLPWLPAVQPLDIIRKPLHSNTSS